MSNEGETCNKNILNTFAHFMSARTFKELKSGFLLFMTVNAIPPTE